MGSIYKRAGRVISWLGVQQTKAIWCLPLSVRLICTIPYRWEPVFSQTLLVKWSSLPLLVMIGYGTKPKFWILWDRRSQLLRLDAIGGGFGCFKSLCLPRMFLLCAVLKLLPTSVLGTHGKFWGKQQTPLMLLHDPKVQKQWIWLLSQSHGGVTLFGGTHGSELRVLPPNGMITTRTFCTKIVTIR